jgi:hypothetical protein
MRMRINLLQCCVSNIHEDIFYCHNMTQHNATTHNFRKLQNQYKIPILYVIKRVLYNHLPLPEK